MVLKRVLLIDDEENILTSLKGMLEDEHFVVETAKSGSVGLYKLKQFSPDVTLLDIWMPEEDGISVLSKIRLLDDNAFVIMMSGHGTVETAVKAIKLGAFDFLEKPLDFDKVLLLLNHVFELRALKSENRDLREALLGNWQLIGETEAMVRLRRLISVTAPSNGWVLVQGENGTGKELVARALHQGSLRSTGRFVAVNCAAIPDELIESELFGHEKGSFTGAYERKIGKFELAHNGTLFLDEVGDMSRKMQAKILRALQEGVIQRVGGSELVEVDVRVIAATNKDLKKEMTSGQFREDLYFRLNVIPIIIPPLRDRFEDIPLLIEYFIKYFSSGKARRINDDASLFLQSYSWPGNVRELKNWVERACILCQTDVIEMNTGDLNPFTSFNLVSSDQISEEKNLKAARSAFEKQFIKKMLAQHGGNISKTAHQIGLERSHLHKKMRTYGIDTTGN